MWEVRLNHFVMLFNKSEYKIINKFSVVSTEEAKKQ